MARRYEQRVRAESAADTRARILDAVYRGLEESPAEAVSVDRVARLAGVARSTIYVVFGSRSGLFDAFGEYLLERAGFDRIRAAVAEPDARDHLRLGIREGCRLYASTRDVTRAVYSMSALDPDALAAMASGIEENRAGGMAHLARRLAEQDVLRDDISVAEATDLLWVLTSFDTFDLLYTGRGLTWPAVADRLSTTAERTLCRSDTEPVKPGRAAPTRRSFPQGDG